MNRQTEPDVALRAGDIDRSLPAILAIGVKDPVCGMTVDPATAAHRLEQHHKSHFFCSSGCHDKFVANPAKYIKPEAPKEIAPTGNAVYTCPMHPQNRQVTPGNCPICGMTLEPIKATAEVGENAELVDMTRRFWIGLALALPVFMLEMGGHIPSLGLDNLIPLRDMDSIRPFDAGCALGRHAFFRTCLGVDRASQPQHVQPDRARDRRRLCL